MGVWQLHLSGGEPASRSSTSSVGGRRAARPGSTPTSSPRESGSTEKRLAALDAAGLDHIQLSVQGVTAEVADRIGGYRGGFDRKMHVAEHIARIGFPLTLNAVMHRDNLDDLPATIAMAERLGARRIEIACVQFQGWALVNRARLQPSRAQVGSGQRPWSARRRHG